MQGHRIVHSDSQSIYRQSWKKVLCFFSPTKHRYRPFYLSLMVSFSYTLLLHVIFGQDVLDIFRYVHKFCQITVISIDLVVVYIEDSGCISGNVFRRLFSDTSCFLIDIFGTDVILIESQNQN